MILPQTLFSPHLIEYQRGKGPHREHLTKSLGHTYGKTETSRGSMACPSSLCKFITDRGLQPKCIDSEACILLTSQCSQPPLSSGNMFQDP